MKIVSNTPEYEKDLLELARLFYPINSESYEDVSINHTYEKLNDSTMQNSFEITTPEGAFDYKKTSNTAENSINFRKTIQIALYEALKDHLKVDMPWGALIGIRPVKMARDLVQNGLSMVSLKNHLKNNYYVSDEKADLLIEIIENQGKLEQNDKLIDIYINIPFCVTRCNYCSFISAEIGKCKSLIEPYIDALIDEIKDTREIIGKRSYVVKTIYIGGGTPTSFSAEQLERILKELQFGVKEFTVEAGRPDTITKEKLDVFKKYGVTRISINPQSFNEKVLEKANRNYTIKEFLDVYKLALNYNFIINMDLILGLDGETLKSFKSGVETLLELAPENITLHTLALKRSSTLNKDKVNIFKPSKVKNMLEYGYKRLKESGYKPYYLYRQKNMVENLENVGFSYGKINCIFNIDSIEENTNIISCGAGGVSKRVFLIENRHELLPNAKGIKEYIERIDEIKKKKAKLF
ncbi:MAG: coproporphyrinogen dehydrogenase HemZ [Spirochaetales bacterium]